MARAPKSGLVFTLGVTACFICIGLWVDNYWLLGVTRSMSQTPSEEQSKIGTSSQSDSADAAPYNIFRDSAVRYMGYANEVGESFRYQFPRLVIPSYVVSFGYCTMDAATTGYQKWFYSSEPKAGERSREIQTAVATFDTMLWQSLASVMIPGVTINMIVKASRFAVARAGLPLIMTKWLPTCAGLGSIPFIVHPIDEAVDVLLDHTTRPLLEEGGVWEQWLSGSTTNQSTAAYFAEENKNATNKPEDVQ